MRASLDLVERRRNLIRTLHYQGYGEVDIICTLDEGKYFPEMQTWKLKRDTVRRDIQIILSTDAQRFHGVETNATQAFHEYVARQETIYKRAMERNDLEAAIRASKDIAKAHGVQTDEVNRPRDDVATIMMTMRQKKLSAPPLEIEEVPTFEPVNGKA